MLIENETTKKGEFVLYFGPLTEDEIIMEDGKRFVKGNGDKTLYLEVEGVTEPKELEAEEGKTTFRILYIKCGSPPKARTSTNGFLSEKKRRKRKVITSVSLR